MVVIRWCLLMAAMFLEIGCAQDFSDDIDKALAEADQLKFSSPADDMDYSKIVSAMDLPAQKRIALSRIQQELYEELTLLRLKEQKLADILSTQLLSTPYDRPRVKAIMNRMIDVAKERAHKRLTAMLKAKNILRYGLSHEELEKVRLSQDAMSVLQSTLAR